MGAYNEIYDFVNMLGLDNNESVYHDGSSILDLIGLDIQIQENIEHTNAIDYYDNLDLCNMVYCVSVEQMQDIIFNRMGVI